MSATALFESVAPPEALVSDLCWLLSRANQLQKAEFDTALTATGLTSRKHQVLATAVGAEHTQTQLARIVGLDKTTMMVTLDELERDGLAERKPVPNDRRARVVAVTVEGRKALRKADKAFAEANDRVLARLPEAERGAFLQALALLACPECADPRVAGVALDGCSAPPG